MHKKSTLILILLSVFFTHKTTIAQNSFDTLNVMVYNLLFFGGSNPSSCTPLTNTVKAQYASQIIGYVKPDIIGVNELSRSQAVADYFLTDVMNTNGRDQYAAAAFFGQGGDNIANMLYYNKEKLRLISQNNISCSPRHANIYNLEYLDAKSAVKPTLSVVVVHLKAGDGSTDRTDRSNCVTNIMNYLRTYHNTAGNYIVMGDFNIYSTNEEAYKKFVELEANENVKLYDPIYALTTLNGTNQSHIYIGQNTTIPSGVWNQASLAQYHTQSTRASSFACGVGGGLDDRFDYILTNKSLLEDSQKMNVIPSTYKAVGNDGSHYDKSINDGANNSVPADILTALYQHSDHLPVSVKLKVRITSPDPFVLLGFMPGITTITASYLNFTISGNIFTSNNTLTISGMLIKDGQTQEATLTGSYLSNLLTQIATVTSYVITKKLPTPPVIGSYFKTTTNIVITASDRVISGSYVENTATNTITITGTEKRNGFDTSSLLTLTGTYTITASNFTLTISPNLYIVVDAPIATTIPFITDAIKEFELYPLPAEDKLFVQSNTTVIENIKVYSVLGELIKKMDLKTQLAEIRLNDVFSGIYFVEINHRYRIKITKQ